MRHRLDSDHREAAVLRCVRSRSNPSNAQRSVYTRIRMSFIISVALFVALVLGLRILVPRIVPADGEGDRSALIGNVVVFTAIALYFLVFGIVRVVSRDWLPAALALVAVVFAGYTCLLSLVELLTHRDLSRWYVGARRQRNRE